MIAVDVDQSKITFKPKLKLVVGIHFYVVNLFFSSVKIKSSKFSLDDAYNIMEPTRERSLNGGIHMNWYQQPSSFEKLKMHRI